MRKKAIPYNFNYEMTIKRIVNGERLFSEESLRLYEFYRDYILQKNPNEMLSVHKKYLEIYDTLPQYKDPKRRRPFEKANQIQ